MSSPANTKVSLDQLVFKSLYYKYQEFLTPLGTIFVCFLLFWFVVIPQIQNWFATQDAITTDTQNLAVLHQNLTTITKLDSAQLDHTLSVATSALPADKDFSGMISALSNAAAFAGTSLQDYTLNIGDLSGLNQLGRPSQQPLQLDVILSGDAFVASKFINQLKSQLPLSDVISVSGNANNTTTVTLVFYYAVLPKITFDDTTPLPILSSTDVKMLGSLVASNQQAPVPVNNPQVTPTVSLAPTTTAVPSLTPTITAIPTSASGSAK